MRRTKNVAEKEPEAPGAFHEIQTAIAQAEQTKREHDANVEAADGLRNRLSETQARIEEAKKSDDLDDITPDQEMVFARARLERIQFQIDSVTGRQPGIEKKWFEQIRILQELHHKSVADFIASLRKEIYWRAATFWELPIDHEWPDEDSMAKANGDPTANQLEWELKVSWWQFHESKNVNQLENGLEQIVTNFSKLREAIEAHPEIATVRDWPKGYYWRPPKPDPMPAVDPYPVGGGPSDDTTKPFGINRQNDLEGPGTLRVKEVSF